MSVGTRILHNRIAEKLKCINYHWNGEKVYQEAGKIVIGIWQHIAYEEYVPFPAYLSPYDGYNNSIDLSISNVFATAVFRYCHSLVPSAFSQLDADFKVVHDDIPLQSAFFNVSTIQERGIEPTLFGTLSNQSRVVNPTFAYDISSKLFVSPDGIKGTINDFRRLNIQTGRDHGLPSCLKWRKYCNL